MSGLIKVAARAAAWTLFQALLYLLVFEAGKAAWVEYTGGWRHDLGRGIMWKYSFQLFVGLTLVVNAMLTTERFGSTWWRRTSVWSVALLPLIVLTLSSWRDGPTPLSVILVLVCAILAIAAREVLGFHWDGPKRKHLSGLPT